MRTFVVAGHEIGAGPCFIIAEAGVNHNGDVALAHRLVDTAAGVGANAVKFQVFQPSRVVSATAATAPYQSERTGEAGQRSMLEDLTLPEGAWKELAAHAEDAGILFFATPFDAASADVLDTLKVPLLKVPSGELDNIRFIEDLATRGKPLLMSVGMGTLAEIESAIDAAGAAPALALLHCVTAYPTPPEDANLRAIPALASRFRVPVGWSDHTTGSVTALGAVALGSALLEKHLTIDRSLPGPDHAASADPLELTEYVARVRELERALGDGVKRPMPSEAENRLHARRSAHAARDLDAGHVLEAEDVVLLRPATGLKADIDPRGLRLRRRVAAGSPITPDDVA